MNHTFEASGSSDTFTLNEGYHNLFASGNFGGGTAKLEFMIGPADYIDVPDVSFTTETLLVKTLGAGRYRWTLTGATSPALKVGPAY